MLTLNLGLDPRYEKVQEGWEWRGSGVGGCRKKSSPEAEGEHMLMHNHNVQYPNLGDYRKIEQ